MRIERVEFSKSSPQSLEIELGFQGKMIDVVGELKLLKLDESDHGGQDVVTLGANGFSR